MFEAASRILRTAIVLLAAVVCLAQEEAPPAITPGSVANAASLMPEGLPGAALPAGGLISMFGPRVAGSDGAVEVLVRQGGKELRATPVFVSEEAVTARLPADLAEGEAVLTVRYHGQSSVPYPVRIGRNVAGIFAVRGEDTACSEVRGWMDRREATPASGRLAAGGRATVFATGTPDSPTVLVGGKRVRVTGVVRDACVPGVDRIEIQLPRNIATGCAVPVMLAGRGAPPSNSVSVGISPHGGACQDAETWAGNGGYVVLLDVRVRLAGSGREAQDGFLQAAGANFGIELAPPGVESFWPPIGSCSVHSGIAAVSKLLGGDDSGARAIGIEGLVGGIPRGPKMDLKYPVMENRDAGAALTIRGPGGERVIGKAPRHPRFYNEELGLRMPGYQRSIAPYLQPGEYEISGEGGADIGPFQVKVDVPKPVELRNSDSLETIDRSRGVTLRWKSYGSEQAAFVLAAGSDARGSASLAICIPKPGSTSFTIPPEALGNMPATVEETPGILNQVGVVAMPASRPRVAEATGTTGIYGVPVSIALQAITYR